MMTIHLILMLLLIALMLVLYFYFSKKEKKKNVDKEVAHRYLYFWVTSLSMYIKLSINHQWDGDNFMLHVSNANIYQKSFILSEADKVTKETNIPILVKFYKSRK